MFIKNVSEKTVDVCLGLSSTLVLIGIVLKYRFNVPASLEESIEAIITHPLESVFSTALNILFPVGFKNAWNGFVIEHSNLSSVLIGIGLAIAAFVAIHRLRHEAPKERNEFLGIIVVALTGFMSLWIYGVMWGWVDVDSSFIGWVALLSLVPFVYTSVYLSVYLLTKVKIFEKKVYDTFIETSRSLVGFDSKKPN